ncbi:MAG: hypothetical protein ABIE68_02015 [bacterium]
MKKKDFFGFYMQEKNKNQKYILDSVTRSLERLIEKECLVGFGSKTPKRFYIKEVRLTLFGRKVARTLYGKQQKLFKR